MHCIKPQIVMYPIINLRNHKMDLHWYLRSLEEVVIRALSTTFSIKASRVEGLTGVWVGKLSDLVVPVVKLVYDLIVSVPVSTSVQSLYTITMSVHKYWCLPRYHYFFLICHGAFRIS